MENTDRKSSVLSWGLIALFIIICGILGYQCVRMSHVREAANQHIRDLQSENEQLQLEIEETAAALSEKDAEVTRLNNSENDLKEMRDQYYAVCKQLEDAVLDGSTDVKIAYLTFDDGPYTKTTGKFLDVLDEYDILATFFQLARTGDDFDALYRRVYESGHTIGNHTYSHVIRQLYTSTDVFIDDVVKNREFIEDKLGYTTNILRFPGGSSTARGIKNDIVEKLRELGYGYVDWNSATGDGVALASVQEYRDAVLKQTYGRKILVVLMHDYSSITLQALPEIIEGLSAQGYIFLPLYYESSMINK